MQLAGVAALSPEADAEVASMTELYLRRRDLVCDALKKIGVDVHPPHATIYVWAPVPDGYDSSAAYCEHVLEQAGVVITPGAVYGPGRGGLVSHLADHARRAPAGGDAAPRRARKVITGAVRPGSRLDGECKEAATAGPR